VGIGGEYPLSAANTAEHATSRGGRQLAITFSMMGWGGLLAPAAFALMLGARVPPARAWRLGFGLGAALSGTGAVLRVCLLRDSPKFVRAKAAERAAADARAAAAPPRSPRGGAADGTALARQPSTAVAEAALGLGTRLAQLVRYWRPLVGTAVCWLLFDIYEYGLNLYSAQIAAAVLSTAGRGGDEEGGGGLGPVGVVLILRLMTMPGYLCAHARTRARAHARTCGALPLSWSLSRFRAHGPLPSHSHVCTLSLALSCSRSRSRSPGRSLSRSLSPARDRPARCPQAGRLEHRGAWTEADDDLGLRGDGRLPPCPRHLLGAHRAQPRPLPARLRAQPSFKLLGRRCRDVRCTGRDLHVDDARVRGARRREGAAFAVSVEARLSVAVPVCVWFVCQ
jgi:hypothetical protein